MARSLVSVALGAAMVVGSIQACSSSSNDDRNGKPDGSTSTVDSGTPAANGDSASVTHEESGTATGDADAEAGGPANCNAPSASPSGGIGDNGSTCAGLIVDAGTTELDAGFDDAGNASRSICNPITNAGCTGTDVCSTDESDAYWVCLPSKGHTLVGLCGDCSSASTMCDPGLVCMGYFSAASGMQYAECAKYCCTDADCGGAAGSCNIGALVEGLPNVVGVCSG